MSIIDRPTPMMSWEKEAEQDLEGVYQSKATPDRGDVDAVWQSMYEVGLKRKVSQYSLPPQATEINGNLSNPGDAQQQETEKEEKKPKDLASVHLERARNLGILAGMDEGRRWRRRARTYSNSSSGEQNHSHADNQNLGKSM